MPEMGQKTIPAHACLSEESKAEFAATSHVGLPEAINAMTKITGECEELGKLNLFSTSFAGAVTLGEFEDTQVEAFGDLQMALNSTSATVGSHIRFALYHVDESWKAEHEMGFTIMVNKRMQDGLRDLVEAGLRSQPPNVPRPKTKPRRLMAHELQGS